MSLEADLVAALEGDSDIATLVADRIYLQEASQDDGALPFIAYEIVSSVPVQMHGTAQEVNETVIDVACHATTLTAAKALADLVRDVLLVSLEAAVIENTADARDRDTRRKSVIQSYRVWHDEVFP